VAASRSSATSRPRAPGRTARHRLRHRLRGDGRLLGFYALLTEADPPELDLAFVADDTQGKGYRRMGAERVGAVGPVPPKVTWERPEPWFAVGRPSAP
jgi:hypothetical protein